MFVKLPQDLLQYLLFEWLSPQEIGQLDIACLNHNQRKIYYQTLQSFTCPFFHNIGILSLNVLQLCLQWGKQRCIKQLFHTLSIDFSQFNDESYEYLNEEPNSELSNEPIDTIQRLEDLEKLENLGENWKNEENDLSIVKELTQLNNITRLVLFSPTIDILLTLFSLSSSSSSNSLSASLTYLGFYYIQILKFNHINLFTGLQHLQSISFVYSSIDSFVFHNLSYISTLTHLTYTNQHCIPIETFEYIGQLTQLTYLNLDNTQATDGNAYSLCQSLFCLQEIYLLNTNITLFALMTLFSMSSLQKVYAQDCLLVENHEVLSHQHLLSQFNSQINSEHMNSSSQELLINCHHLHSLDLTNTSLPNHIFQTILTNCPQIITLAISQTKLSTYLPTYISSLTWLQVLEINDTSIQDDELSQLYQLHSLLSLSLNQNHQLTYFGFVNISQLQHLQQLYLNETKINDSTLIELSQMSSLQLLSICKCSLITLEGIDILQSNHKNLTILS